MTSLMFSGCTEQSSRSVTPTDSSHLVPHPLIAPDKTAPAQITSWFSTYTLPAPEVC